MVTKMIRIQRLLNRLSKNNSQKEKSKKRYRKWQKRPNRKHVNRNSKMDRRNVYIFIDCSEKRTGTRKTRNQYIKRKVKDARHQIETRKKSRSTYSL